MITQNNITVDKRFQALDMTMKRYQYNQDALIEILHKAQEVFGYLDKKVLLYIANALNLSFSQVYGVATFYPLFSLKPSCDHKCLVCKGTTCYLKGASELLAAIEKEIGIHPGEITADGKISLTTARCIGTCGIAPAVVFDGQVFGKQTPAEILARFRKWLTSPSGGEKQNAKKQMQSAQ